jgi:hypothetical protein
MIRLRFDGSSWKLRRKRSRLTEKSKQTGTVRYRMLHIIRAASWSFTRRSAQHPFQQSSMASRMAFHTSRTHYQSYAGDLRGWLAGSARGMTCISPVLTSLSQARASLRNLHTGIPLKLHAQRTKSEKIAVTNVGQANASSKKL